MRLFYFMPLLLRSLRKKRANLVNLNTIAFEMLQEAMDKQVGPLLVKSHQRIVADWEHKPDFDSRTQIRSDIIITTVYPIGPNDKIWLFVDQGTKPHPIEAKNAPRLIFQTGYQAKTLAKPARTVSGGGKATGPVVVAKKVQHPGSEAREFSKTIAEDIKPDYNRLIDNTFKKIAKKVEE